MDGFPICTDGVCTPSLTTRTAKLPKNRSVFCHSDHLGSLFLITNFDGEAERHVEYVP